MNITLITPTADQPLGISLCERWMLRQTLPWQQWIIADDGDLPARPTLGQLHLHARRQYDGGRSLAANLLRALPHVTGDTVVIIEHDDWYAADHLATCLDGLREAAITGSPRQRYYHIGARAGIIMRNHGSALCNTALRSKHLDHLQAAAQWAFDHGQIGVDRALWERLMPRGLITETETVVGIKGLPGRAGLGIGHRPFQRPGWREDPRGVLLRKWVGEDAGVYLDLAKAAA